MAPYITAFCHPQATPIETETVRVLDKYYTVFIDSEIDPTTIKEKYKGSRHKFFGRDKFDDWCSYEVDEVDKIPPLFVLTFDPDTEPDWDLAFDFCVTIFSDEPDQELITEMYKMVPKPPLACKLCVAPSKDAVKENNEYMFSHFISTEKDMCVCQIDKPFTDKPYTLVIEEFSKNDFEPLFTGLYICNSWGVSPKDTIFLVHLWNHLDMKTKFGKIDLEERLKRSVMECRQGKPEPRVYRENIAHVKDLFKL